MVLSCSFKNVFGSKFFSLITKISAPMTFPPYCSSPNVRIISAFACGKCKSIL